MQQLFTILKLKNSAGLTGGGEVMSHMTAFCRFMIVAVGISRRLLRVGETPTSSTIFWHSFAGKLFCIAGLLSAVAGLSSTPVKAHEAAEIPGFGNAMTWNLGATTVLNKGQADVLTEGKFAHDFILEAKATAANPSGSLIPADTFKLVLSTFSPAADQQGQEKGVWYAQGLTDDNAPGAANSGPRAGVIAGRISAELAFNQVITQKNWTAKLRLPNTRIAPVAHAGSNQLAREDSALMVDGKHEGKLSLNLRLQPLMPYQ